MTWTRRQLLRHSSETGHVHCDQVIMPFITARSATADNASRPGVPAPACEGGGDQSRRSSHTIDDQAGPGALAASDWRVFRGIFLYARSFFNNLGRDACLLVSYHLFPDVSRILSLRLLALKGLNAENFEETASLAALNQTRYFVLARTYNNQHHPESQMIWVTLVQ